MCVPFPSPAVFLQCLFVLNAIQPFSSQPFEQTSQQPINNNFAGNNGISSQNQQPFPSSLQQNYQPPGQPQQFPNQSPSAPQPNSNVQYPAPAMPVVPAMAANAFGQALAPAAPAPAPAAEPAVAKLSPILGEVFWCIRFPWIPCDRERISYLAQNISPMQPVESYSRKVSRVVNHRVRDAGLVGNVDATLDLQVLVGR